MSDAIQPIKTVLNDPEKYPDELVNAALKAAVFHQPKNATIPKES